MKAFFVTALFSSLCLFGCASASDSSPSDDSSDDALRAAASLSGTFDLAAENALKFDYKTYTFKSNGTYTATGSSASGSGTYKIAKVSKQTMITLDDKASGSETFYFSHDGNTLTFNKTLEGPTEYFYDTGWTRKIPIGDLCQTSSGKSLGECDDSGNFACGLDGTQGNVYACVPLD